MNRTARSARTPHTGHPGRAGWLLLAFLVGIGIAFPVLSQLTPRLPHALGAMGFLSWLLWIFVVLRPTGRKWAATPLAWVPFVVLLSYSTLVSPAPFSETQYVSGIADMIRVSSVFAGIAYIFLWDHIAAAVAREPSGEGVQLSSYLVTMLLCLMPPFAILWVQFQMKTGRT